MLDIDEWPFDGKRIKRYIRNEHLYRSRHDKAFAERIAQQLYKKVGGDGLTFLVIDFPKTIVNIPANLLVGHAPVISYQDQTLNDALKRVMERSRLETVLLEAAQAAGFRGDSVLEARLSPRGVVVEPKPAYSYYPELSPDNCRDVLSEQLAWKRPWGDKNVLRVDRYLSGEIYREAYRLGEGNRVGKPYTGRDLQSILGGDPIIPSGLKSDDGLVNTLVHIPNYRADNDFWGESDLGGGLPTLFEEADERLSQISRILDKHADPKMVGSKMNMSPDGLAKMMQMGYIEISPNASVTPSYLTWDAQLIAAFSHYKAVVDEIFRHSEICPMLAGYVAGARYDSGRAYKMQMAPTLAKTSRKRIYMNPALKEILQIAVAMELKVRLEDVPAPTIRWRDGLPKDLAEQSQTENNRIASGTSSRRSSIKRLDDIDDAGADDELALIRAEQEQFGGVKMPPQIQTPEANAEGSEDGTA